MDSNSVGVSNLPNQRYKIVNDRGGVFNLMVCGESGLGKTTFINTLFQTSLKPVVQRASSGSSGSVASIEKTVQIDIIRALLEEKGFQMRFNIVDTPGFGDNAKNNKSWQTIIDFIDDQHDSYMRQEQQPYRDVKFDLRIHAVLYFIRPTGHGLKPLDIETMKRLSTRANLIPVIAKADTLTQSELTNFKLRIRQVIETQEIRIFTPAISESATTESDAAAMEHARQLIESMPFAIIGSEKSFTNESGKLVPARKYPWGLAEVENDIHCDFRKLRSLLLRTNLLDLITTTQEYHYETYRSLRLSENNKDTMTTKKLLSNNPKFKQEENSLKKYFTEQVKIEEQRFRQWEQNIVNERIRLNTDLEEIQSKIKKLEDQVKHLQLKKR